MDKLLEMKNISKSFSGVKVLHDVDFSLNKGEIIALCGENGAGKSTLVKILMGIYSKDSGQIFYKGEPIDHLTALDRFNMGMSMIHQEFNLVEQLSIYQNIFLGREIRKSNGFLDISAMAKKSAEVMAKLKETVPVTTPVKKLKVAQKQIVEIARAICFDCDIIVMDEPTAVLTDRETEILFDTVRELKKRGVAVIYISHRLAEIKQICDKVIILRDGNFVAEKNIDEVTEHQIASLMVGRELEDTAPRAFSGDPDDIALEVSNVSDELLKNVSFKARKGEVVGFGGLIGAGRTELMEYIFGLRKVKTGEIYINGKKTVCKSPVQAMFNGIGFATEDRKKSGIVPIRSINDNINYGYLLKKKGLFNNGRQMLENTSRMKQRMNLICRNASQLIKTLSGGNQQKVVLGKWLLIDSNILLLDEPTRGIDVGARAEIYQIINTMADEGKTIVIVSSDLPELLKVCPRIIVMYEGQVMGELEGENRTEENFMSLASGLKTV
ncbi:ATP-binding cassette domain-containing protein [Ruthenibacterium lactatiformans]|uniref:ATP-binding cassette domain-containing protein n=1 Tax=Ruthenibacterium lactatiformans TaxID=1550024 RepID=UPI001566130E